MLDSWGRFVYRRRWAVLAASVVLLADDPILAAHHFAWLTIGKDLDHGMFFDPAAASKASELNGAADAAVRVFLLAYARRR